MTVYENAGITVAVKIKVDEKGAYTWDFLTFKVRVLVLVCSDFSDHYVCR